MGDYKTYNTGIYLRLSRDDGENKESESINNQREFLLKYVIDNKLSLVDIYIDDGWSGTNFNRPSFQRMIQDVENGKINCIVTKDLSRLGRDYIMTGHYLEKYFPERNVRYIAVNDGVDTFENNSNNDMTPFRAVFNDMYAKDISKKVRTALNVKKQKGDFIGSVPPYGYKKDVNDKGHLVIDEDTACIVRRMYEMYINGASTTQIARIFTSEQIPTPSQKKNLAATQGVALRGVWNSAIIKRILSNPTYIGNITQNWSTKINYKINKKRNIPTDQHITVNGTHEPIISQNDFQLAQAIMQKRSYKPLHNNQEHKLAGLLVCKDCGKRMTFQSDRGERSYAVCSIYRRYGKKVCTGHYMREDALEKEIIKNLKQHISNYLNKDDVVAHTVSEDNEKDELKNTLQRLERELADYSTTITNAYIDKSKGILSESDFMSISANINTDRVRVSKQIETLKAKLSLRKEIEQDYTALRGMLEKFLSLKNIDRHMLSVLIDKIVVYQDKTFDIYYNFHI